MIFQGGVKLDIKGKDVQAIFDFDTGLIGFTERKNNKDIEHYFHKAPNEFKIALFNKLQLLFEDRTNSNLKICRKNQSVINFLSNI